MKKTRKKIKNENNNKSSFESENKIEKLKILIIIVNRNQGQFFVNRFLNFCVKWAINSNKTATND